LAVYLHITYLYRQAPQLSEMTSPIEKSFCVIEYAETNSCTSVQRSCDFFLCGYVKEQVSVPPLPLDIGELTLRITAAIETIDMNILLRVWDELEYRTGHLSGHECSSH
jgi:hypothetical protein